MRRMQTRGVVIAGALLFAMLVAEPVGAQVSQFDWELKGGKPGEGIVSGENLVVLGPDGDCDSGSPIVWLETTAPSSGTVSVVYVFTSFDLFCGGLGPAESGEWDVPVQVINGGATEVFTFCSSSGVMKLHVEEGDTFGFGVRSVDCRFGPGLLEVKTLVFTPDEEPGAGPSPDAVSGRQAHRLRLPHALKTADGSDS